MSQKKSPRFELRSGNVDALLLALKTTDIAALRDDLLSRFESTPDFFSNDVVALDLRRLEGDDQVALDTVIETLALLKARAIGVVAREAQRGWAESFGLPLLDSQSRRGGRDEAPQAEPAAPAGPRPPKHWPTPRLRPRPRQRPRPPKWKPPPRLPSPKPRRAACPPC
ncbi:hypothetical protein [Cupriavidus sp. D39]|uniref:hypothetical protein n=1 Tax=Cupriavidus sp. D39 TaxID=2997877 RepID=UPI002270E0E7|nr:hypothetical protein [Cupriavidus sp. D39]MCY0857230.1 hypothetical protein [Cupriavidus sp. D39]